MSDPFSEIPEPESPRPIRRPSQPGPVQEAFRAVQEAVRAALPVVQGKLRRTRGIAKEELQRAQRIAKEELRRAQRYSNDLWLRGKRNPRTVGAIGGAVALTLVGAIALSASGAGRSLCPPVSRGKAPQFRLLMDPLPQVAVGSELEIHYDVCGLASGTSYQARVRLVPQKTPGKKKSAKPKPKPMVVTFKDQADGVATRRHEQLELGSTKPGSYTLELSVADSRGRERKRVQKILIKPVRR